MASLRGHLKDNGAKVLIISDRFAVDRHGTESLELWRRAFEALVPAHDIITRVFSDVRPGASPDAGPELIGFATELRPNPKVDGTNETLVVVYAGSAGLRTPKADSSNQCYGAGRDPSCSLHPLGGTELAALREAWNGELVVFFDAPFGGVLAEDAPPDIPLFLAAREPNGMTYIKSESVPSTTSVVAAAFEQGVEDLANYPPILAANQRRSSEFPENYRFTPGTPAWVPGRGRNFGEMVRAQFTPLQRLGFQVAAGCLTKSLEECDLVGAENRDGPDPFDLLKTAAEKDLAGDLAGAIDSYRQTEAAFRTMPPPVDSLGSNGSRAALERIIETVSRRAGGAESKMSRRVLILPVGVEDYSSFLIADVPHALSDLAAYAAELSDVLTNDVTQVETLPVVRPSTAAEFLDALRAARAQLGDDTDDLLIMIFSGRGTAFGGKQYLVTAGADFLELSRASTGSSQTSSEAWLDVEKHLVDIGSIAAAAKGAWFFGVYDAQFTAPRRDGRVDQILDKHIDSVRPSETGREASPGRGSPFENAGTRLEARGEIPPRQVHLWLDGVLTQARQPPHRCLSERSPPPNVASPLAAAILSQLPPANPGTYRDWFTSVAKDPCLASDEESRTLVMQGDFNVPFLASGEGAEFVDYFHDDVARDDLNLRSALAVAEDMVARFDSPRNKLSVAAIALALAELHAADAMLHGVQDDVLSWLKTATAILDDQVRNRQLLDEDSAALRPIQLELLSRAHYLADRPDLARDALYDAPVDILEQRGLAEALVAMTSEALRRQPSEMLTKIEAKFLLFPQTSPVRSNALPLLEERMRAERSRLAEPYKIRLPVLSVR